MRYARALVVGVVFAALVATVPAMAEQEDGHGRGKEHGRQDSDRERGGHEREQNSGYGKREKHESIRQSDRTVIHSYLMEQGDHHCPPGLAKKHNSCLPPGHAKRYRIGYPVPKGLVLLPLPETVRYRLTPPPGYYYAQVDGDVVLVAEATKKIIDAMTLLSAVK